MFSENKIANYNDGVCEDVETFRNIWYTPAWYYKKWPGFLNVESYKILAGWDWGVRTEEEWLEAQGVEEEKEEEEELQFMLETEKPDIEILNKKRKQKSVYLEVGFEQPQP